MPLSPFDPTNDDHSPLNDQPSSSDGIDYTNLIGNFNENGTMVLTPAALLETPPPSAPIPMPDFTNFDTSNLPPIDSTPTADLSDPYADLLSQANQPFGNGMTNFGAPPANNNPSNGISGAISSFSNPDPSGFSSGFPSYNQPPPPYQPNNNFGYDDAGDSLSAPNPWLNGLSAAIQQPNWPLSPIQQPQPNPNFGNPPFPQNYGLQAQSQPFPQNNSIINNDVERIGEFPHYATNTQKSSYWQQQQSMAAAAASQFPLPTSGSDPYDANAGTWQTNITGTVFGGKNDRNTSAYDGNYTIADETRGVSLPGNNLLGKWVEVRRRDNGKTTVVPVIEKGPHYPIFHNDSQQYEYDPYWETNSRPKAEIKWRNKSGIDFTPQTLSDLGVKQGVNYTGKPWADETILYDWRFIKFPSNKKK